MSACGADAGGTTPTRRPVSASISPVAQIRPRRGATSIPGTRGAGRQKTLAADEKKTAPGAWHVLIIGTRRAADLAAGPRLAA
jgi:hypothetical protein